MLSLTQAKETLTRRSASPYEDVFMVLRVARP
jgi:hypothetical protein